MQVRNIRRYRVAIPGQMILNPGGTATVDPDPIIQKMIAMNILAEYLPPTELPGVSLESVAELEVVAEIVGVQAEGPKKRGRRKKEVADAGTS